MNGVNTICPLCGRDAGRYAYDSCLRPAGQAGCMRCAMTGHVLPELYPYFPYGGSVPYCRLRRTLKQ